MFRRITYERILEYEGREVLGKGFKEDSVVDPDEMEPRILGNDDLSALYSLSIQRRDIATILLWHPPQSTRYRLEVLWPDFAVNEIKQPFFIAKFDPGKTWQVINRCIQITVELIIFVEGTWHGTEEVSIWVDIFWSARLRIR